MSALVSNRQNSRFKTGWVLLLIATALMALNHSVLIFALDEPTLFIGYTAFNFYALTVLLIPFRRFERWAWYCMWILPLGLVAPAFLNPDIAIIYYVFTAVCMFGLLLTRQEFFAGPERA
jgi:hypothetical protein